jgi:predicted lipid-binding transport protein (Tim44 family)
MLSYFSEQLAVNASKGETNTIDDVKLEQGELAEAWNEGPIDYATVSMAFSALDYNLSVDDGRVVSGSKTARERVTETWTFMRQAPGGRWLLSAIQQ